jgi:hypothetical protein
MADDSHAREVILEALRPWAERCGVEVEDVTCLDAHLLGHAFKYHKQGRNIAGVYPYRIAFVDRDGVRRTVDAMVKAKPDEADIVAVYQGLLDHAGIETSSPVPPMLRHSDYTTPNLKELVLFRDFTGRLKPYVPDSYGFYVDEATSYTLRIEERLVDGSLILDPDDDTTERWQPGFSDLTLRGIAAIHGRFLDNTRELLDMGYIFDCNSEVMLQAEEIWQGLYGFLGRTFADVMTSERSARHREILESLAEWYGEVDRRPKTLLYGDVNPQNLAFAKTGDGFELSLFDWERAVISLPQRDLAEHLIYTLPEGFGEAPARAEIATYRAALAEASGKDVDDASFDQDLVWMLYDLILNRLPLMMVVKHVANKRRHADVGYINAHRLVDMLS